MTSERKFTIGAVVYALVAVVTFGHAAAAAERAEIAAYEQCLKTDEICLQGIPGMNGFMAATFWPFYWSWEAFE